MKKIISAFCASLMLMGVLFPLGYLPAFADAPYDTATTSGKWSALTWSLGYKPGNTEIYVHKTGINDTCDYDTTLLGFYAPPVANVWSMLNRTIHIAGSIWYDSSTGVATYPKLLYLDSVNTNMRVSSGVGTRTATACSLAVTGTGTTIKDDKGLTIARLSFGVQTATTLSGSGTTILKASVPALVFAANCKLTNNGALRLQPTAACTPYTFDTLTDTIIGSGTFDLRPAVSNAKFTLPALTMCSTGATGFSYTVVTYTADTFNFTGNQNFGSTPLQFVLVVGTGALGVWRLNSSNLTCLNLTDGVSGGQTGTTIVSFGSGTHNIRYYNGTSKNTAGQSQIDSFATSHITLRGMQSNAFTSAFGTNHTIVAGSSVWTIADSTHNITSNGQVFADSLCINPISNMTITMVDKWKVRALNVANGTLAITNHATPDSITGGAYFNGGVANFSGDSINFLGDITMNLPGVITGDAGTLLRTYKNWTNINLNGDSIPVPLQLMSNANFLSSAATGGIFHNFYMPTAGGDTAKFQAAKRWFFKLKPIWRGTLRNYVMSLILGQRDTLTVAGKDTLHNLWVQGNFFTDTNYCKRSDSCYSGGWNK